METKIKQLIRTKYLKKGAACWLKSCSRVRPAWLYELSSAIHWTQLAWFKSSMRLAFKLADDSPPFARWFDEALVPFRRYDADDDENDELNMNLGFGKMPRNLLFDRRNEGFFLCRGQLFSTLRNFNVAGLNSEFALKLNKKILNRKLYISFFSNGFWFYPKKHFLNENFNGERLSSSKV